ncbi:LysE family translocator [Pseudomonas palleroniana]|uniref:LysE family translocator n=2 Tax=Pseudomonas TaxID=286 RepID=UPI000B05910B|nr:LysE family translocator [Pseudomonas palleroniana]
MAATGVSAILLQFAEALFVLKIVGGAYLLFLALKAGRSALTPDEKIEKALGAAPPISGFGLYRRGLLMHLTNPKALLGWIATMTLGLGPQATPETVMIILAGCAVLSISIFCGYAIVFSTAPMIRGYRRARRWIEGTLALVFGAAGFKLLFSRA